jgi:Ca2+-transporting ATPase
LQGLTTQEARKRLEQFGPNELRKAPGPGVLGMFVQQFKDVLVLLLIAVAGISAAAREIVDTLAILAIVLVNAVIGVVQEFRAEKALEALKEMAAPLAKVNRDGVWAPLPARELVPGDLVSLETGDKVPADLQVRDSANLRADESILTGESVPVDKSAGDLLFASTTVVYGRATAIVVETGMQTRVGHLAEQLAQMPSDEPPLKRKLAQAGRGMVVAGLLLMALTFAIGARRGEPWLEMLLTSVSLGVAAIPEGLPAIVTVVLALGTRRRSRRNAIIRKLASVETLGSVTVICSDKTGTITRNEMSVTEIYCGGRHYLVEGSGYEPTGDIVLSSQGPVMVPAGDAVEAQASPDWAARGGLPALLLSGVLASDAVLQKAGSEWTILGDPTEGALVVVAAKAGIQRDEAERKYPRVDEAPFDSDRKMMTTIHQLSRSGGGVTGHVSFTKGAPHVVLRNCDSVVTQDGIVPLDDAERNQMANVVTGMASRALRVLAVAFREHSDDLLMARQEVESGLVFLGFWGMIDPPRPEVKRAVRLAMRAGVRPIMITGDQAATGMAIAREVGIAGPDTVAVTGKDIQAAGDQTLARIVGQASVFAQVSPEDKSRIVSALKSNGEVVAMTGDGVNDAPALNLADIGVAMGIRGTDVAKEASDMVLADDNFATIVAAIEEGRTIYSNIAKSLRFLLSCNLSELVTVIGAIIAGLGSPLSAAQILWMNLVTDSVPAIAVGMEKPEKEVLETGPPDPKRSIIPPALLWRTGLEGLWMSGLGLATYVSSLGSGAEGAYARTVCFATLVCAQLFHANDARSNTQSLFKMGLTTSAPMNAAAVASVLLQTLLFASPLARVFGLVTLSPRDWAYVLLASITIVPFSELLKVLSRRRSPAGVEGPE